MPFSMNDPMLVGPTALSAINLNMIDGIDSSWTDVSQFNALYVQLIVGAVSAGAVTFEFTNDPVNASAGVSATYVLVSSTTAVETAGALTLVASSANIYAVKVLAKYFRVRISTALVTATAQVVVYLTQSPSKSPILQQIFPATAASISHVATLAASTNPTSVKTTAGSVFEICITNLSAAALFFKLYAKASAPTVGTDVPIWTIQVPANSSVEREFGPLGKRVLTGIAYAVTAAQPDADVAAVSAGSKVSMTYA